MTSLSVNLWQKEKNGQITRIKRIGLITKQLMKSQVSREPFVWEKGSVLYQHGPRLPAGQHRSCKRILKQASFGRDLKNFWCMPWKLVCQESRYKGTLVCGYQGCWRNNKAFRTENSYKQHLWSKVGTEGHPNRMQLDAWELRDYLVPHGQKPYPLWDQALGKIKDVDPASSDDEVLHRAQAGGGGCVKLMDKQKEKMRERLLYGPPDQEGEGGEEEDPPESDDSVSEFTVKSDYNVTHDVISDEEVERKKTSKLSLTPTSKAKAIERSKESKAKEKKDPRPPLPRLRKEEKKEKKEKKEKSTSKGQRQGQCCFSTSCVVQGYFEGQGQRQCCTSTSVCHAKTSEGA